MAHSIKLSPRIQKWVNENPEKVDDYHVEHDQFGEYQQGPFSHWIYLKRPYVNSESGTSMIHEATVKEVFEMIEYIEKDAEWWTETYPESQAE